MRRLWKEPLFHFFLLGMGIFLFHALSGDGNRDDNEGQNILVTRAALLTFLQQRSKAFEPETFVKILDSMPGEKKQQLVDEYIREEVLTREAKRLGLERNDYVIRRRLIQKMEFLAESRVQQEARPGPEDVRRYFESRQRDYKVEANVTFTHVFLDKKKHGTDQIEQKARRLLKKLNREQVPFAGAPRHGDRFPFHVNYVERSRNLVSTHFGGTLADAVFTLPVNSGQWQGPLTSSHGLHLVLLTAREEQNLPEWQTIETRVTQDAHRFALREKQEQAISEIIETYRIETEPELIPPAESPTQ